MVSKFLMRSILAVSLVFFMGTTAWAVISNTSTTQTSCTAKNRLLKLCSIEVEGLLKQLGNVTKNPTAFAASILILEGFIVSLNPAGNTGQAEGTPFVNIRVQLDGEVPVNANQVSKNGRALSDIVFHDDELIAAIIAAIEAQCSGGAGDPEQCDTLLQIQKQLEQHPNWIQTVVVTKLEVLGEQWTDPDTTTPTCNLQDRNPDPNIVEVIIDETFCQRVDALGTKCDAPPAVVLNPQNYAWEAFTYACTESCHDATGTSCSPYALPLP